MKINSITYIKWLYKCRIFTILSHYAMGLLHPSKNYIRRIKRNLSIKHIQGLIIESVSKPDSWFSSSACEKPIKKKKPPKLWGRPDCKEMCYVFFPVPSRVRAATTSFYGSLLLLMFCKIDFILPMTHLACCLSPQALWILLFLLSQLDMKLSCRYNFITTSLFMLVLSSSQFLRI